MYVRTYKCMYAYAYMLNCSKINKANVDDIETSKTHVGKRFCKNLVNDRIDTL